MNFLRNIFDKLEPIAKKNKYLHTTLDAFETFVFTPKTVTKQGVHIRDGIDLKRTMVHVVLALQLCLLFGMFNIGHQHYTALGLYPDVFDGFFVKLAYGIIQLLPMIIVVHVVGLGIEFIFAASKGHSVEEGFLVTGMLIPLIMPPALPLWMVAVATAFAVIIAKEAFGGTGMNILNIALTARVFVFFAYPTEISGDVCWVSYDYNILHKITGMQQHTMDLLGMAAVPAGGFASMLADGFSGATPLALAAKGGIDNVLQFFTTSDLIWGLIPGSVGEMNKPFIVFGIIFLIATGIGSWKIMFSMLLGCISFGLLLNAVAPSFPENLFLAVPWYYHIIMGSFLFALAFMATDPVTGASTEKGKYIYGFMIGVLGLLIRVLNPAYPEGWMLAILFMNVFAPLIDHVILQGNINRRLARG
jgi:Na+-transporting NADH:ubiquinone oxidoreductase subunit B